MSTWVCKEPCERPCEASVQTEPSGKNECVYVSVLLHKHAEFYFTFASGTDFSSGLVSLLCHTNNNPRVRKYSLFYQPLCSMGVVIVLHCCELCLHAVIVLPRC